MRTSTLLREAREENVRLVAAGQRFAAHIALCARRAVKVTLARPPTALKQSPPPGRSTGSMPNAGRILCLAVSAALTAAGSRSQQLPADVQAEKPPSQLQKQWEKDRQAAVAVLRQALARAKTADDRAPLEKQLKWIESGEAARADERIWQAIMAAHRTALAEAKTDKDRAQIAKQLARLERGLPAFDEKESLELSGYKVADARRAPPRRVRRRSCAGRLHAELGPELDPVGIDRTRPVAVICETGYRSTTALALLRAAGFTQLHNVRDGMRGWRANQLPVAT